MLVLGATLAFSARPPAAAAAAASSAAVPQGATGAASSASSAAVPQGATVAASSASSATVPQGATGAASSASSATVPQGATGAKASTPTSRSGPTLRRSAPAIALAALAALLAIGCIAWGVMRLLALEPSWAPTLRHSFAEAGFRVSATWAELLDWLRLGR